MANMSIAVRNRILELAMIGGEGHIGSSFSIVEILLAVLTAASDDALDARTKQHLVTARLETFVLSKGHAAVGLYAVLLELGVITPASVANFAQDGSAFGGHPTKMADPPIKFSTGSLGHGLPLCLGAAFASSRQGAKGNFICLCGDGEINEGSIWESLLLIQKFSLSNVTIVVDNNGSSTRAIDLGGITKKFDSFGLSVIEVDGHDVSALRTALSRASESNMATAIVAKTIKGYGSNVTANSFAWHHKVPNARDVEKIVAGYYL